MLTLKRAEVERRVADEQAKLARIAARLRQIEQEHTLAYEVVVRVLDEILTPGARREES